MKILFYDAKKYDELSFNASLANYPELQLDYLENLNRRYDEFIYKMYKGRVMVIEKDDLDYLNNPKDFSQIVDRIDATLFGLFPE